MSVKEIIVSNPRSDNMGDSFRVLLEVLEKMETIEADDNIIIDLTRLKFVHPFLTLPLCALITNYDNRIEIKYSRATGGYLETIKFPFGFNALSAENWNEYLLNFRDKTYLPICQIPVSANATLIREELLTTFENIALHQLKITGQMISVIKYLISEAIDNIVDHANVFNGWIMIQNYPQKGFLDVCILDTGLGILGSYKSFGVPNIDTDVEALKQAINGNSTKQITETRGYGIDTSRQMLVDGLKGKYFLFSGSAFYIYTSELEQITPLIGTIKWSGTMLALRIPCAAPTGFDYISFLE